MSDQAAGALMFLTLALAFYFLPTLIALTRSHNQTVPIFVVNLLLGWTLVGWVVALVWACLNRGPAGPREVDGARMPCPRCAEMILRQAQVCRFCGCEVSASGGRATGTAG